jgi:hypothetical protein
MFLYSFLYVLFVKCIKSFYMLIPHSYIVHPSIHPWLYSPWVPWPLFQFLNLYIVCKTPWTGDQSVARPLTTHRTTQTRNKCTQTSIPRVVFEPTIPLFERAKTLHASDKAVAVTGSRLVTITKKNIFHIFLCLDRSLMQDIYLASSFPKHY